MSHPVEPPTRTRTVHFTAPPPADVADRCIASADVANGIAAVMRDGFEIGPQRRTLIAEQLRRIVVDLVLAAGYLNGAVS